ncbi:zinc ABC transporter substrate-binding protein [Salinibacterium sp. SYSU T00001]|uniref:metal ABC transporter solute-binding protein, Zn/Mn family n=1 Tax=Homoserinimonas sedimenticola TaxID=2986805 RepID=UPI002235DCD3|nr:zinc ABC transporter substrate-binding protein [Salinibacterium sedimenticola]MCW4385773.1 zinc ABC transporter substrate-binding protein [Salinibacterium sedimenticola]
MTGYIRATSVVLAASAAVALAGCASPSAGEAEDELTIVASTDVYGDIASAIVGDRASVTSIISGSAQDPHSYEATARDQLALSRADIVIENGGGYDPFIDTLLAALEEPAPVVLTVTDISGLLGEGSAHEHAEDEHAEEEHAEEDSHEGHDHSEGNEHVWYSFEAIHALAEEVAHHLAELDAEGAEEYEANLASFESGLEGLEERAYELHEQYEGAGVAVTEPAPLYLFEEIGLVNQTPAEFSSAIEAGTDVAPSVLLEMQQLIESGSLALLAYNEQTSGPETDQVVALAEEQGLPVVTIAETLPEGIGYLDWMSDNLDAISSALS